MVDSEPNAEEQAQIAAAIQASLNPQNNVPNPDLEMHPISVRQTNLYDFTAGYRK